MARLSEIKVTFSPWGAISEADRRRAALVTGHLISRLDYVTDWRLQKSYYLAEVWSIEERLCRLSNVEFASWTHGPWSLHVREAEETLEAEGLIVRVRQRARRRPEAEFLRITEGTELPAIAESEEEFLDSFASQIKYVGGETLTKIAKATSPFQTTKPEHLVDLDGYLQALQKKHDRFTRSRKVARLISQAKAE